MTDYKFRKELVQDQHESHYDRLFKL